MDLGRKPQQFPLWLKDGNLVLITSDVAFKVHRGLLERHSEIFKDIFMLPQPDVRPEFEGFPVIHMTDDPRDLEHFLLALYDGLYFQQRRAYNFVVIGGVLRLSTKYIVEHLRVECLSLLQHDWPLTLAGWDLRECESTSPEGIYESSLIRPHPIYIINLAYELGPAGAPLLPAAFYDLSRYNCSHIWTGCAPLSQNSEFSTHCRENDGVLSMDDLKAVMIGKEASQSFIAQFLRRELEERDIAVLCEHRQFQDGLECRNAFNDLAHELYRGVVGVTYARDSDPLFTLDAAMIMQRRADDGGAGHHPASRACEQCRAEFAQVAMDARSDMWDRLPGWFGLEGVLRER